MARTVSHRNIFDNNAAVRKMLVERGIIPENLLAAEDVKKVERRLESEKRRCLDRRRFNTKIGLQSKMRSKEVRFTIDSDFP